MTEPTLHPGARIAVIIPALNEEASLPKVLTSLPWEVVDKVVVVDNGSCDRTAEVARAEGATVLHENRKGYGWACLAGIRFLEDSSPDVLVFLDGDFSDYPEDLYDVVRPIVREDYDFVVGTRTQLAGKGALLWHARFGNALTTLLIRDRKSTR